MPTCDESRIQQFLQHQLSPAEQDELERHLESCETCCRRLERSTADPVWWEQTSWFLPDAADDLKPLSQMVRATARADTRTASGGGDPIDADVAGPLPAVVQNVLRLLAPSDDPDRLGRIGTYEVAGVIGAGGMSVVLKAFDGSLNRYVAIKVLAPHLATSGAARKRFAREAQAAAAVVHENVIAIFGVDEAMGLPYLVMPYVKGESLQRRLDAQGPLEVKEILRIATQTAAGLSAAHAQGLIHRDVKPANILLADGVERVTITDFGLARAADDASLTRTGTIAGTPQYMSPEQARGEAVDQRSDLFSLGSVIYAMGTGHAPFRAESSYAVLRRITDGHPRPIREVNAEIPVWLCRLVQRLHAKSPHDRYTSAAEVEADLRQCLAFVQQPTRASLPAELADSAVKRIFAEHRRLVGGLFAVAALIVLLATWPSLNGPTRSTQSAAPRSAHKNHQVGPRQPAARPSRPREDPTEQNAAASAAEVTYGQPGESDSSDSDVESWTDLTDFELIELQRATLELEAQLQSEWDGLDHSKPFELDPRAVNPP